MRTLLFILIFPFIGQTQISENKFYVYGKASVGKMDTALYNNFSLSGEYIFKGVVGINYNFDFIHRNDNIFQLHTSMGTIAGPLVLLAMGGSGGYYYSSSYYKTAMAVALIALLLPDGISAHIPFRYNWDFSPYVNFLGFDYVKYKTYNYHQFHYSSSFGFKTSYWTSNNFTVLAFAEVRKVRTMGYGYGMGVGIGYTFKPRN